MIDINKEKQSKGAVSFKEQAVSFLKLVASGNVDEAYRRYIGSEFHHHNAFFQGDADSLKLAMKEDATENPNKIFKIKHAIEEGEMVAVHSHVKQNPEDLGAAVVHIFRFHDGHIVELWDLGQPIPESPPNNNGMF
ncbi:Predicted SnoaL-like aldol condensation-catalyzing enzyme [Virgibacillus subterraneus]|uniref:Predicted SnoaL-like aldol condensation-catalyzing enzyme n=1 Tax=Virgibacillus subterraneus TaxID=621109 RepID=A0A1H8ZE73_9BACI|nr:nuclear transport factor 2 family protein [Virgibacillus subterraneus]SEP62018.1 Predicted SnoaL-like aldol condensation-catalyzing enzyme [Virgibacillus subterraneus]